jgi:hypothetical protein
LVSATTLTCASFVAAGLDLRLDLVHCHRFIGMSAHGGNHSAEIGYGLVEHDFPLYQADDSVWFEQPSAGGPPGNGRRQIYSDIHSHGNIRACPVEFFLLRLINARWTKAPQTLS